MTRSIGREVSTSTLCARLGSTLDKPAYLFWPLARVSTVPSAVVCELSVQAQVLSSGLYAPGSTRSGAPMRLHAPTRDVPSYVVRYALASHPIPSSPHRLPASADAIGAWIRLVW